MAASPQFIPIKRGKEWSTVASWRESPSLKAKEAPGQHHAKGTPPPSPVPTQPVPGSEGKGSRRRGKSTQGAPEETFDDFMVKCALGDVTKAEAERCLVAAGIRPLRCIVISAARSIPMTRIGVDNRDKTVSPPAEPYPTPAASSGGVAAPDADAFKTPYHGNAVPSMDDDGMGLPEMTLPPSIPSNALDTQELHYFFMNSADEVEKAVKVLLQENSSIAAESYTRRRSLLNSTLVIKNLPFCLKLDTLLTVIESLPHPPSYVRLHRGERGLFKCVIFVKYPNRVAAECSKLELDRLTIGHKPLKVEFKKRARAADASIPNSNVRETARLTGFAHLEKAIKDLRASNENEGFFYPKSALNKDEVKYLKQLVTNFDLLFESNDDKITVKRKAISFGGGAGGSTASASPPNNSGGNKQPSPAIKPSTPPWAPATPGSLQPMEFRGISHWKAMRQKGGSVGPGSGDPSGLPIHRPSGVGDSKAFPAGRGRPVATPAA